LADGEDNTTFVRMLWMKTTIIASGIIMSEHQADLRWGQLTRLGAG
jgi:hypothetical protein